MYKVQFVHVLSLFLFAIKGCLKPISTQLDFFGLFELVQIWSEFNSIQVQLGQSNSTKIFTLDINISTTQVLEYMKLILHSLFAFCKKRYWKWNGKARTKISS